MRSRLAFHPAYLNETYLIEGTQLVCDNVNEDLHIYLKNFRSKDFQFRSKMLQSGYKIYTKGG